MPTSYYYDDADSSTSADDGDTRMVDNPKLAAIQAVKSRATTAQTSLASWTPTSTTGTTTQSTGSFDAGLTEDVWTSPVGDSYRGKISAADSNAEDALEDIVSDLTAAENAIFDAGEDMVPADSDLAKWPSI
ncbi:hypothetical protein [Actinomyces sp. MRS3W]|uniref:hypothetical protein n=1 Tax=Actinomyces sp. MRS3W TaxID=2800796 RepID=UPI0028FDC3BF|nr:hypothetical protein [Actinomyces sp. MRS3W]MDU0347557.1 hypothetical protein [Actinomyces sp. MRS3W]